MKSLVLFVVVQAAILCKVWASIDNDRSPSALLVSSTTTPDHITVASDTKTSEEGKAEQAFLLQKSAILTFLRVEIEIEF